VANRHVVRVQIILRMERTTTSPVFTPTRINNGARPLLTESIGIPPHLVLHPQGGIEGALRVVFVGNGAPKRAKMPSPRLGRHSLRSDGRRPS